MVGDGDGPVVGAIVCGEFVGVSENKDKFMTAKFEGSYCLEF